MVCSSAPVALAGCTPWRAWNSRMSGRCSWRCERGHFASQQERRARTFPRQSALPTLKKNIAWFNIPRLHTCFFCKPRCNNHCLATFNLYTNVCVQALLCLSQWVSAALAGNIQWKAWTSKMTRKRSCVCTRPTSLAQWKTLIVSTSPITILNRISKI